MTEQECCVTRARGEDPAAGAPDASVPEPTRSEAGSGCRRIGNPLYRNSYRGVQRVHGRESHQVCRDCHIWYVRCPSFPAPNPRSSVRALTLLKIGTRAATSGRHEPAHRRNGVHSRSKHDGRIEEKVRIPDGRTCTSIARTSNGPRRLSTGPTRSLGSGCTNDLFEP